MIITEGIHTGEFLLSEANGTLSREQLVFKAGPAMAAGTVIGKITAGGKHVPYKKSASDGSEVAVGVLYAGLPASAADQPGVAIVRYAEVAALRLTGNDADSVTALAGRGVIVR